MNARQTYLAWVRTTQPRVYYAALNQVFGRNSGLSGLGDDLTDSITPSLTSTDDLSSSLTVAPSSDVTDAVNSAYNASVSPSSSTQGGSTDYFSALTNAISNIGSTVINTQAQENLLQINTQRAAQGLPPLTANGVPVTGSMLSPTSATLAQMEAALSGSSGIILPVLLIGGAVLVAMAMSKR